MVSCQQLLQLSADGCIQLVSCASSMNATQTLLSLLVLFPLLVAARYTLSAHWVHHYGCYLHTRPRLRLRLRTRDLSGLALGSGFSLAYWSSIQQVVWVAGRDGEARCSLPVHTNDHVVAQLVHHH
jgi:hypothetical protein